MERRTLLFPTSVTVTIAFKEMSFIQDMESFYLDHTCAAGIPRLYDTDSDSFDQSLLDSEVDISDSGYSSEDNDDESVMCHSEENSYVSSKSYYCLHDVDPFPTTKLLAQLLPFVFTSTKEAYCGYIDEHYKAMLNAFVKYMFSLDPKRYSNYKLIHKHSTIGDGKFYTQPCIFRKFPNFAMEIGISQGREVTPVIDGDWWVKQSTEITDCLLIDISLKDNSLYFRVANYSRSRANQHHGYKFLKGVNLNGTRMASSLENGKERLNWTNPEITTPGVSVLRERDLWKIWNLYNTLLNRK